MGRMVLLLTLGLQSPTPHLTSGRVVGSLGCRRGQAWEVMADK
jgi:hypothetical protein